MAHFIIGHGDNTCFLFSGGHKVSAAFYVLISWGSLLPARKCSLVLSGTTAAIMTADSDAVKQLRPKTEVCMFLKPVS